MKLTTLLFGIFLSVQYLFLPTPAYAAQTYFDVINRLPTAHLAPTGWDSGAMIEFKNVTRTVTCKITNRHSREVASDIFCVSLTPDRNFQSVTVKPEFCSKKNFYSNMVDLKSKVYIGSCDDGIQLPDIDDSPYLNRRVVRLGVFICGTYPPQSVICFNTQSKNGFIINQSLIKPITTATVLDLAYGPIDQPRSTKPPATKAPGTRPPVR